MGELLRWLKVKLAPMIRIHGVLVDVFGEGVLIIGESGERYIRVVFNGALATGTPLIARMAVEMGIEANIAYASTRSIGDKAYGSMLLGISGGGDKVRQAIDYLTATPCVLAEEVTINA